MRKNDILFAHETSKRLSEFGTKVHQLPGIGQESAKLTFLFQIIESVRRIRFVHQVSQREIAQARKAPSSDLFDPIRAAILYKKTDDLDEAAWLVFLFVHFGKNLKSEYRLLADVYGKLGQTKYWTWNEVSEDPLSFRHWLDRNQRNLKTVGGKHRAFGNHRKYQSLNAWKPNGTGDAIQSYVSWVKAAGNHKDLFEKASVEANNSPEKAFAILYRSMTAVRSFGRTAKFDYLSMLGKLQLANIRPDSVHFDGATGPVLGARLLFDGNIKSKTSNRTLEKLSNRLADSLQVDKQVIEDSLCNWQKSPEEPLRFRG